MLKVGIIGAGQTGRGFLAQLLHGSAELVFADRDETLIRRLRDTGAYRVRYYGGAKPEERIGGFAALTLSESPRALADCDVLMLSVRPENTPAAGAWLVENGLGGHPVVVCENAADPAGLVASAGIRAASGAIFCTTVADGLDIESEGFPTLYVSANCPSALKSLPGFAAVDNFQTLMERKLYTYNAASGIIAYLGAEKGYEDYAQAANDPEIDAALTVFYREINRAVCREYHLGTEEQENFAALSRKKFQNPAIRDTVSRNAASPVRKLGAKERILEPIRLIERQDGDASVLYRTAAAALRYAGAREEADARTLLSEKIRLPKEDSRFERILRAFAQKGGNELDSI